MPAPGSSSKHSSMQPTRPAPTPPIGTTLHSPSSSPVKRSPSSPYPLRSAAESSSGSNSSAGGGGGGSGSRPIITVPSSGLPVSEFNPHRPAPRPPPAVSSSSTTSGKRASNVLVKGGAHRVSQSTSSINSSERSSRTSPSSASAPQRGPPPPAPPIYVPMSPPMQYNPDFSSNSAPQSARLPANGAGGTTPTTPNNRSRKSDGTSPVTSRQSPRAHSDEYGTTKSDKSIFGKFVSGMAKGLGSNSSKREKMEISTPYDPVHLTHVGFNYHTGEFTVCWHCIAIE